ncbi:hypothetical protein IG631_13676 [Alternaria alternata]|nr:hypothetical protein IG631_13676 [Alternaria alternata]
MSIQRSDERACVRGRLGCSLGEIIACFWGLCCVIIPPSMSSRRCACCTGAQISDGWGWAGYASITTWCKHASLGSLIVTARVSASVWV